MIRAQLSVSMPSRPPKILGMAVQKVFRQFWFIPKIIQDKGGIVKKMDKILRKVFISIMIALLIGDKSCAHLTTYVLCRKTRGPR